MEGYELGGTAILRINGIGFLVLVRNASRYYTASRQQTWRGVKIRREWQ